MAKEKKIKNYKKGYPYTLKEFPNGPVLKKDGTPFKYGSIIPLIGGESLGCALATQTKPSFLLSYSAFAANELHMKNYWPDVPYFNLDEFLEGENQRSLDELKDYFADVDFVNTVCPCAGLSSMNASTNRSDRSRGSDAVQNKWMYDSSRFVLEHIKPKVFWGENAPALFTNIGKGVADNLAQIAKDFGYSFSLMKTNSLLHGLPQRRERTFYFFWKSKTAPIMNYHFKEALQLQDYLALIPADLEHSDEYASNRLEERFPSYEFLLKKENLTHSEFVAKHPQHTLHGYLNSTGLAEDAKKYIIENYGENHGELRYINHMLTKLADHKGWWDASPHFFYSHYSAVVARNMWCGLHPIEKRYMSVRELLWLMGMPLDFNFKRNEKNDYVINMLAQNVPVITAKDQALEVMNFINGDLPFSNETYFRQNNNKPVALNVSKSLF
jgi:site-specific DNA-cytosine methylase